ncbi:MAG: hypothetical protein HDQ87_07820 [Clostridia bacterium]|nr:hypothetical protein [Clostridia bacterium]
MIPSRESADQVIGAYVDRLGAASPDACGAAGIICGPESPFVLPEAAVYVDTSMPLGDFLDLFASMFWLYVDRSGCDYVEASALIDAVFDHACEFPGHDENGAELAPLTEVEIFREVSADFMDALKERFTDVVPFSGLIWPDDTCSIQSDSRLRGRDIGEIINGLLMQLLRSKRLTPKEAEALLERALERLRGQTGGQDK